MDVNKRRSTMNTTRYRVPTRTTEEILETSWHHTVKYGEYVIIAGHYWWVGAEGSNWYAGIFQYIDDNKKNVDDDMELVELTEIEFEDPGHAYRWAFETIESWHQE